MSSFRGRNARQSGRLTPLPHEDEYDEESSSTHLKTPSTPKAPDSLRQVDYRDFSHYHWYYMYYYNFHVQIQSLRILFFFFQFEDSSGWYHVDDHGQSRGRDYQRSASIRPTRTPSAFWSTFIPNHYIILLCFWPYTYIKYYPNWFTTIRG